MKVALFFTKRLSLVSWNKTGSLSRELSLYKALQTLGVSFVFISYGGREEDQFLSELPGITVCYNKWGLPKKIYEFLVPLLHWRTLKNVDLIKTNQMNGAEIALRASRILRKPFLARCGYLWSKNVALESGGVHSRLSKRVLSIERKVFNGADSIVVTSEEAKEAITSRFPQLSSKIDIIPNGVDVSLFKPPEKEKESGRVLCFVGRLAPEKNLETLFSALKNIDAELRVIGKGPLKKRLEGVAAGNPKISFHGTVPNGQLPLFFNRSNVFVFPTLYEGHPKALIEAMASGLPVVATNVSGVREIITHMENGYLCNTDEESLRAGLLTVLNDQDLQIKLGAAARQYALAHYDLSKLAEREYAVYQQIMCENER